MLMSWVQTKTKLTEEFVKGLLETGAYQEGDFILVSGERSSYYFDLRRIFGNPKWFKTLSDALLKVVQNEIINETHMDGVAGIPTAGLPYATYLSLHLDLPLYYPRVKIKDYGTKQTVEGGEVKDKQILLVDDLITSATSKIEAVEALESEGAIVKHLCVLLDREQGGVQRLAEHGVTIHSLCKISEIIYQLKSEDD